MDILPKKTPILLPNVTREMLSSEYWIKRAGANPVLLSGFREEPFLNQDRLADYPESIQQKIQSLYNKDNSVDSFRSLAAVINSKYFFKEPLWGIVTAAADLKLLPRDEPLYSRPSQLDLDRNQLSMLDPGDICQIFSQTNTGWSGVVTAHGIGWIKNGNVGIANDAELNLFADAEQLLTITGPTALIKLKSGTAWARMGTSLPGLGGKEVLFPDRDLQGKLRLTKGIVAGETTPGHLEKTFSNFLKQAFKYLGYSYAWGDHDPDGHGLDCSRLVRDALRTMGVRLPRDSQQQLMAGEAKLSLAGLSLWGKTKQIKSMAPGGLIFTPNHVMIYLGSSSGGLYVIHGLYNYLELWNKQEQLKRVKQIVVSDLLLGEGTSSGSLLKRITALIKVFGNGGSNEANNCDCGCYS